MYILQCEILHLSFSFFLPHFCIVIVVVALFVFRFVGKFIISAGYMLCACARLSAACRSICVADQQNCKGFNAKAQDQANIVWQTVRKRAKMRISRHACRNLRHTFLWVYNFVRCGLIFFVEFFCVGVE